jgi:hypothetical protein
MVTVPSEAAASFVPEANTGMASISRVRATIAIFFIILSFTNKFLVYLLALLVY